MKVNKGIKIRIAVLFFLSSFLLASFVLCLFNILRFYFFPSNIAINMLLIGFPVGGIIAISCFKLSFRSFIKSLTIAKAAIFISLLLCFAYSHFAYLRSIGPSQEVNVSLLIADTLAVILIFMPYFVAYGIMEFIAYRIGERVFLRKFGAIYAVFLTGAAAAYGFISLALPLIGLIRSVILILFLLCIISMARPGPRLLFARLEALALAVLFFYPGLDAKAMNLLEGNFPLSVQELQRRGDRIICRQWMRNGYFSLTYNEDNKSLHGFYNNYLFWSREDSAKTIFPLEGVPYLLLREGSDVSVIGSGGGRQVSLALKYNPRRVVAIDIDAEVLDLLKNKFSKYTQDVYNQKNVTLAAINGRIYHASSDDKFDLIYIAAAGGSPYALNIFLEPSLTLHTVEGMAVLKQKIKPDGMIAVFRPLSIDPTGILLNQEFQCLKSLGFSAIALKDKSSYVLVAALERYNGRSTIRLLKEAYSRLPPGKDQDYEVIEDMPDIALPTDNSPLPANAVLFRVHFPVSSLRYGSAVFIILVLMLLYLLINSVNKFRREEPGYLPRQSLAIIPLSVLVGLNFSMIEMMLIFIFSLFLPNPIDAVAIGSFYLLVFASIGSALSHKRRYLYILNILVLASLIWLCILRSFSTPLLLILLLPPVISTGTFFPQIFRGDKHRLISVFIGDSLGAVIGMFLTLFLCWSYGFYSFYAVALAVYLASLLSILFFRRCQALRRAEERLM